MQKYEHIKYQYPAGCRTVEVEDGRSIAVCTTTGEVYGEYITSDFTPNHKDKYPTVCPADARCREEVEEYIKLYYDKRKWRTMEWWDDLKRENDFQVKTFYAKPFITTPQYKLLKKLSKSLLLRNMWVGAKEDLAKLIGCRKDLVRGRMEALAPYCRYTEEGMRKGEVKFFFSPVWCYSYDTRMFYSAKNNDIKAWYGVDKELQERVLLEPFVGPQLPPKEYKWSRAALGLFGQLNNPNKEGK